MHLVCGVEHVQKHLSLEFTKLLTYGCKGHSHRKCRLGIRWGYAFPFAGDAHLAPPSSTAGKHNNTLH